MVLRFQQDVIALKPAVVVINGGTNDIAGNTGPSTLKMIEDNLKSMTELAANNKIKVVLASVTPVFDYPWKTGTTACGEGYCFECMDERLLFTRQLCFRRLFFSDV